MGRDEAAECGESALKESCCWRWYEKVMTSAQQAPDRHTESLQLMPTLQRYWLCCCRVDIRQAISPFCLTAETRPLTVLACSTDFHHVQSHVTLAVRS